jgi:hypothetical protein
MPAGELERLTAGSWHRSATVHGSRSKKKAQESNRASRAFQRGLLQIAVKTASTTTNYRQGDFDRHLPVSR